MAENRGAAPRPPPDGSDRALNDAIAALRPKMVQFVRAKMPRRLQARLDEDDVVQQAFARVLTRRDSQVAMHPKALGAYLMKTTKTVLVDLIREHGAAVRNPAREERQPVESSLSGTSPADRIAAPLSTPSMKVRRKEETERIEAAMKLLSPERREVVRLKMIEGLTHEEVAARLKIPFQTARDRYIKALVIVARELGDDDSAAGAPCGARPPRIR
jgi:RNA polymerase sigma-70 factor, ECF subfamily